MKHAQIWPIYPQMKTDYKRRTCLWALERHSCLETSKTLWRLAHQILQDQTVSDNKLNIVYENVTESSYSEVVVRVMSFSRADCYNFYSCTDPSIQDMALTDFDPLECGFTVVEITKGEKCFVQRSDDSTLEEGDESKIVFP